MTSTSTPVSAPLSSTEKPHVVTALFRTSADAEGTIEKLTEAGIPRDAVRLMPGYERDLPEGARNSDGVDPAQGKWFVTALSEFFISDDQRNLYADGLNRGGCLVSVHVGPADHDRIIDILDREGRIDTDEPDLV